MAAQQVKHATLDAAKATASLTSKAIHSLTPSFHVRRERTSKETILPDFKNWPSGETGVRVLETDVQLPSTALFDCLFGPNAPVSEISRQKAGSHSYLETAWLPCEKDAREAYHELVSSSGELVSSSGAREQKGEQVQPASSEYAGRCRINCSQSTQLGKNALSFEREQIVEAPGGGSVTVEICVCSTGPMGNKFRCLFLHRIQSQDSQHSRWTVDYLLVFVEHVNFLLRKPVELGANGAVKSNFNTMREVLKEYAANHAAQ